jgi:hypothetical protein
VAALAFLLLAIYGLSRIYLEIGGDGAVAMAVGITIGILIVAMYLAMNPRVPGWQIAGFFVIIAGVLAGGTIWAVSEEDAEGENGEHVEEPTAEPGGESPSAPPGPGGESILMHDNFFTVDGSDNNPDITAAMGDELAVVNEGAAIHNIRVAGPDGDYNSDDDIVSDPDTIRGGQEGTLTVDLDPGDYDYQCDFHPTEMLGTFTVQ